MRQGFVAGVTVSGSLDIKSAWGQRWQQASPAARATALLLCGMVLLSSCTPMETHGLAATPSVTRGHDETGTPGTTRITPGPSPSRWLAVPEETAEVQETPVAEETALRGPAGFSFVEPATAVVMGSLGSFAISYIVGSQGLPAASDVFFYVRNRPSWSSMQMTDAGGPGYVSLRASRPSVARILSTHGDEEETYTRVRTMERLNAGEQLTLTYENAQSPDWGAPRRVEFPVCVKRPRQETCALVPHGSYPELIAARAGRLLAVAPGIVSPGEPFAISVAAVWNVSPDRHYAGTVEVSCSDPKALLPLPYTFSELDGGIHRFDGVRLSGSGVFTCTLRDVMDSVRPAVTNPVVTDWPGSESIYFGDLHVHTQLHRDWEINEPDDLDLAYEYAQDVTALDFVAITDHDSWMTDEEWQLNAQKATEYNQPQRFVTFSAYEWGGAGLHRASIGCPPGQTEYGHRNVYFSGDSGPLARFRDGCFAPEELWRRLAAGAEPATPGRVLTIPHHPSVWPGVEMNWDYFNPQYDRLVEIVQFRGSSEYEPGEKGQPHPASVQAALSRGYRLGFVGGTDSHLGRAGILTGMSAILAPELTRGALFDALYERHTYATTGARILIDFRADGRPMGSEYKTQEAPFFEARVVGTGPIGRLDLVKNNLDVYTLVDQEQDVSFTWTDAQFSSSAFYYLRITQDDGEMAWTSPIWIDAAPY